MGNYIDFLLARTRHTQCLFMVALAFICDNPTKITLCYFWLGIYKLSDPMVWYHWILIDRLLHSLCNWWTGSLLIYVWSYKYHCLSHFGASFCSGLMSRIGHFTKLDSINILMFLSVLLLMVEQILFILTIGQQSCVEKTIGNWRLPWLRFPGFMSRLNQNCSTTTVRSLDEIAIANTSWFGFWQKKWNLSQSLAILQMNGCENCQSNWLVWQNWWISFVSCATVLAKVLGERGWRHRLEMCSLACEEMNARVGNGMGR